MQAGYHLEMSNGSVARGKRTLDSTVSDGEARPLKKRPVLASVVVEALKVDSLQKICSSLEPILRRVVSEEVERALSKLGPPRVNKRVPPKRIERHDGRNLQLHFRSKLSLPLFTGSRVEGEQGAAIHFVLIDANTGHIVTTGPESSIRLDVVVLEGDFNKDDEEKWTWEEFESHIVKEREGKRPLLAGELQVVMKDGLGTLGDLTFTDNSSWIRSRKFRLGLKVSSGYIEGIRVREARTEPFSVKDHRGELYKKHYPPIYNDEVWRLEKVGKDGSFHKRLNKAEVYTVEDFLRFLVRDSLRLRSILGSGMSNKMWDVLVEHAKTCVLSGKLYVYFPDDVRNVGVVFNSIYELNGWISDGQYLPVDSLSENQKVTVDTLMKDAYENWMHVVEYDGDSPLAFTETKISGSSQVDPAITLQNYSSSFDHQLLIPTLPVTVPRKQHYMDPDPTVGGYEDNGISTIRYPIPSQNVNPDPSDPLDISSFSVPSQQFMGTLQQTHLPGSEGSLAIHPPQQPSVANFHACSTSSHVAFGGTDEYFSEDDIRMRSHHQVLSSDDMQYLIRTLNISAGGDHSCQTSSMNATKDGFPYSSSSSMHMASPSSNYCLDEYQMGSSGKGVVGWLKLKAALRWGIFVSKKAADHRRARIIELEDS